MNINIILLLLSLLFQFKNCEIVLDKFIGNYFEAFYIHQLIVFACWHEQDTVTFIKGIAKLNMKVSYNLIQINDTENFENILKVNYYHVGVMLDYDCPNSHIILDQLTQPPLPDLQTYISTPINPHLDTMSRFHFALVMQLRDFYNFTINLSRAKTWGYKINGTWDGTLGEINRGIADVGVSPMQITAERLEVCDFTVQTWLVSLYFMFRHPKKSDVRNGFIKPFTDDIWYVSAVVAIICWGFLYLTSQMEVYLYKLKVKENSLQSFPASETGLITFAAISQQGLSDTPSVLSGRIVVLTLFLWALLVFQFYSASIVGSLLATPPRWIKTLKNLSDSSLGCAMEDIGYSMDHWVWAKDPLSVEFYERKMKPTVKMPKGSYLKADEGFAKVRKGGFAFHIDTASGYKMIKDTFTEAEICELQEIEIVTPRKTFMVTAKHSPFRKMIIYGLQKSIEHGLTSRLKSIWQHQRPQCPESYSSKPTPVPLKEFLPVVVFLLIGAGCSLFILIVEFIFYYYQKNKEISDGDTLSETISIDEEKNSVVLSE